MPGLTVALVEVAVIHWNEVNIAEDKTIIVILLQSLRVTNVEELGAIERLLASLPLRKEMIPREDEAKLQNTHLMQMKSHLRKWWKCHKMSTKHKTFRAIKKNAPLLKQIKLIKSVHAAGYGRYQFNISQYGYRISGNIKMKQLTNTNFSSLYFLL